MMTWLDRDQSLSLQQTLVLQGGLVTFGYFLNAAWQCLEILLCCTKTVRDGFVVPALPPGLDTSWKFGILL